MSVYTPQVGEVSPERLTAGDRRRAIDELRRLRPLYPKLDMGPLVLDGLLHPPLSPGECSLAALARSISADLHTPLTPCQLGGAPDCSQCGCMAAAGVGAFARYKLFGVVPLQTLVSGSQKVGSASQWLRARGRPGLKAGTYPPGSRH
jgi:hypothetical protein